MAKTRPAKGGSTEGPTTRAARAAVRLADVGDGAELSAREAAIALIKLHETAFGGKPGGQKIRASDAALRTVTGRPFLGTSFLEEVAMHLARAGFDLLRMEGYVVVQRARLHEAVRRTTKSLRTAAREAVKAGDHSLTGLPEIKIAGEAEED